MHVPSETIRRLLGLERRLSVRMAARGRTESGEFLHDEVEAGLWEPEADTTSGESGQEGNFTIDEPRGTADADQEPQTSMTVRVERLKDENYNAFTPVLQQPESKYPPLLRLDDLHRPVSKVVVDVAATDYRQLIPIFIERDREASCYLEIRLNRMADARVLFIEVPESVGGMREVSEQDAEEDNDRRLPAIYTMIHLEEGARLETATVHDLRRIDPETGERIETPPHEVRMSARPSTAMEDRPVYLTLSQVEKDAYHKSLTVNLQESLHAYQRVVLTGEGASCDASAALYVPTGHIQHYQVDVVHAAPNTRSNVLNHGVADAGAEGSFMARGQMNKGVAGSNCDQTSRFLTLDADARAFVDPVLVIDEYDVKAGHAGSSGMIDESSLYYMQSRGIDREQAERLITQGFLNPLIDELALDRARDMTHEILHDADGGDAL